MKTAVVIVAGGAGTRAGGDGLPKQYRLVGGMPMLARAIAAFHRHKRIDAIQPVIRAADSARYAAVASRFAGRLAEPAEGGATRQESVCAGLEAQACHRPEAVLIHDAARPFLPAAVIDRVLDALESHAGAIPAVAVSDTLKRASGEMVAETVDRTGLWAVQTPQGFRFDAILAAHRAAQAAGARDFTDDASVAQWHGIEVALVEGDAVNLKLTTEEDFSLAEARFAAGEVRVGQGFDAHAFAPGDHVMLCGVKLPHDKALAGHSDADVGLHALTDALLGAIGDGDIGVHFPPSEEKWRGAPSELFLRDAAARIRALGGVIVNADVTLICQAPKIGPHRAAMVATVTAMLNLEPGRVSVKATTTEGLGFTGRGEGIAAQATVCVRLPV